MFEEKEYFQILKLKMYNENFQILKSIKVEKKVRKFTEKYEIHGKTEKFTEKLRNSRKNGKISPKKLII